MELQRGRVLINTQVQLQAQAVLLEWLHMLQMILQAPQWMLDAVLHGGLLKILRLMSLVLQAPPTQTHQGLQLVPVAVDKLVTLQEAVATRRQEVEQATELSWSMRQLPHSPWSRKAQRI